MSPRNELILAHLRATRRFAARYARHLPNRIERADLAAEAVLGLVAAAATYDRRKGEFLTYAWHRIRGAMTDYVNRHFRRHGSPAQHTGDSPVVLAAEAEMLTAATVGLDRRETMLVRMVYDGQSLDDAARAIGVSAGRVSQMLPRIRQMVLLKMIDAPELLAVA